MARGDDGLPLRTESLVAYFFLLLVSGAIDLTCPVFFGIFLSSFDVLTLLYFQ